MISKSSMVTDLSIGFDRLRRIIGKATTSYATVPSRSVWSTVAGRGGGTSISASEAPLEGLLALSNTIVPYATDRGGSGFAVAIRASSASAETASSSSSALMTLEASTSMESFAVSSVAVASGC
jgi:hypothetical protein